MGSQLYRQPSMPTYTDLLEGRTPVGYDGGLVDLSFGLRYGSGQDITHTVLVSPGSASNHTAPSVGPCGLPDTRGRGSGQSGDDRGLVSRGRAAVGTTGVRAAGTRTGGSIRAGGAVHRGGDDADGYAAEVAGREVWDDYRRQSRQSSTSAITRGVAKINVRADDTPGDCDGAGGEDCSAGDGGNDNDDDDDGEMEIRPLGKKRGGPRATSKSSEPRAGRRGKKTAGDASTGDGAKSRDFWTVEHMIALVRAKRDQDLHLAGLGHNMGRMKTKTWKWADIESRLLQMGVTTRKADDCGKKWDNLGGKAQPAQKGDATAIGTRTAAADHSGRTGVAEGQGPGKPLREAVGQCADYFIAIANGDAGVEPPAMLILPPNDVPRFKIEDPAQREPALRRARNVEKLVLRVIHRWIFKSASQLAGFARAESYISVDIATDVARAVWQGQEWSNVVSPALAYHTLALKMDVPLWFVGVKIVDRPEDDDMAARQEATVLRIAECWTDALWCGQWADGGRVKQERLFRLADCLRALLSACMWIMRMGGDDDRSHYEACLYSSMVAKPTMIAAGSYIFNWRRHIVDSANLVLDHKDRIHRRLHVIARENQLLGHDVNEEPKYEKTNAEDEYYISDPVALLLRDGLDLYSVVEYKNKHLKESDRDGRPSLAIARVSGRRKSCRPTMAGHDFNRTNR
ncbi:hypothetical protein CBR_g4806 [Chara braunii]|uniref:Myb-like domain-containing protein n=1 Tax=Chara braunii TaxID=69332 RepID=A0A388KIZ2_CHABU|nr:hypothetical protein CBR_g4806 [Chara braunii]|eukprot:GBG69978.1 hypothetical protein CBR_g4806 [Chara braunii]